LATPATFTAAATLPAAEVVHDAAEKRQCYAMSLERH
jgi:hypothetical protein